MNIEGSRGTKFSALLVLAVIVIIAACSNNPYPPESSRLIGYTALGEDPRTLDPAQASDTTSTEILCQIYDSLYQNSYLDRPYRVIPALAADYPQKRIFTEEVLERGKLKEVARMEYIFKLRDDVHF